MSPRRAGVPRRGLGQTEVLVVIAIIAVALGLLLPLPMQHRAASTQATSANNLRLIGLAALNFHDTFLRFPGNGVGGSGYAHPDAAADFSFHYQVLPFVELDALFRSSHVAQATPVVVRCYLEPARGRIGYIPASAAVTAGPVADYAVNLHILYGNSDKGYDAAALRGGTLDLAAVTDGPANTILAGSKAMRPAATNLRAALSPKGGERLVFERPAGVAGRPAGPPTGRYAGGVVARLP